MSTIKEYTINIPVQFNDGTVIPETKYEIMEVKALSLFGGYTLQRTVNTGAWRDPSTGKVYIEDMYALKIATDTAYKNISEYVKFLKTLFKQEAMYCVQSGIVEFI